MNQEHIKTYFKRVFLDFLGEFCQIWKINETYVRDYFRFRCSACPVQLANLKA